MFSNKSFPQQQWIRQSNMTTKALRSISFVDSNKIWISGDTATMLYSSNGGLNWMFQSVPVLNDIQKVFFLNERLGWALAWDLSVNYGTIILKTTNGGVNWDSARYYPDYTILFTIKFLDSLTGYIGGFNTGILKTTNGGLNWVNCQIDSSMVSYFPIRNFQFYNHNFGYACGGYVDIAGIVWRTTNAGQRWGVYPISPEPVVDMHFVDQNYAFGIGGDLEYGASTVTTTDGGTNWVYKTIGSFGFPYAMDFRTDAEGWVAMGYIQKFLLTLDTGRNWTEIDVTDSATIFDVKFMNSNIGYAVGDNGVILKYNTLIGIGNNQIMLNRSSPVLYQNYPNPFNPVTSINYYLPERSVVKIKIYDMLGRDLKTYSLGIKNSGEHTFRFTAQGLNSGVYFYRLFINELNRTGNSSVITKKMILIK